MTALMMVRDGSDGATGQQQALAVLDRVITGQAAVLSFEHAFQIIALLFLVALLVTPLLPAGARRTAGAAPSVNL